MMPAPEAGIDSLAYSPNDPPWGSLAAFSGWAISVILIIVLPGLVLMPYLLTLDPAIKDSKAIVEFAQTDKTAIFLQVLAIIPAHILTLLFAWFVVTKGRRYSFRQTLGWDSGGVRWWQYAAILIGFLAVASVVGHFVPEQENDLIRILRSSRATVYLVVFYGDFYSSDRRGGGLPRTTLFCGSANGRSSNCFFCGDDVVRSCPCTAVLPELLDDILAYSAKCSFDRGCEYGQKISGLASFFT
jgi:hypothetical protein